MTEVIEELTQALNSLEQLQSTGCNSPFELFATASSICARARSFHSEIAALEGVCQLLTEASEIARDSQRQHELKQLTSYAISLLKMIIQPKNSNEQVDRHNSFIQTHIQSATARQSRFESHKNGPLLFDVVADRSSEFDLKKIITQEASLRELGQKMTGEWAVIGLYGEYQNCLRVASHLLEIPDLDLPSATEGVAGLYSESKRILILVVIDKDLMYFNIRPYVSKNISTQLIRYLLDVASTIIVCPSDEQLQDWYFTTNKTLANPYVPRVHSHSRRKFIQSETEPLAPKPISVNGLQDSIPLLDGDGMNNTFSFKRLIVSTEDERMRIMRRKREFMIFVADNISNLYHQKEKAIKAFDDRFNQLWMIMKRNCKNRSLPLNHIKQTLTENLKKQYSSVFFRVARMNEELDSVIAKLFATSIEVRIERINIEFQNSEGETTLNLISSHQNTFVGTLSMPDIDSRQVLTLSPEIVLVLFQHQDQTMYFTINSEYGRRFNEAQLNSVPHSLIVVPGSTAQNFFAYSNTRKWARYGSLGDVHGIEGGYNYDCVFSGEIEQIIAGFYLKIKCQLVYINQSGTVFAINFNDSNRTPTKVYDSSGSPLMSGVFLDVRVPDNEQVYVFRTASAFMIYKTDFSFFDQITCKAHQYKVINDPLNFIYLISLGETLQGWKFAIGGTTMQADDLSTARKVIKGNPIVDVLECSADKFGTLNKDSRELLIISNLTTQDDQILKYTKTLPHCRQLFHSIDVLDFKGFSRYSPSWSTQGPSVFQNLASRVPLHIASIQGPNLIPLKNGINSFDEFVRDSKANDADFSTRCATMLEFGLYETELLKTKELKVVSIIGRQSSGKSYLMNRLFGTRFDVATERCTDGIWIGMAVLEGQTYVVLDCEGLLSHHRTAQDEMRMCLALAAVSDVLIFNTDISGINQHSQKLFESMNSACGRLKGEGLFKGSLWITVRDVGDTQYEGMKLEIETRIESLRADGKFKFIMELFGGNCSTVCIHSFKETEYFEADLEQSILDELAKIPARWQSGSTFLDKLKMTLVQIMTDDQENQDDRMLALNIEKTQRIVRGIDFNPDLALTHLGKLAFTDNFVVGQTHFTLTLKEYINITSGLQSFESRFLEATSNEVKKLHHNDWHTELNRFIKAYFAKRKELALQFIQRQLGDSPLIQSEVHKQQLLASNKLKLNTFALCLKNCRQCLNVCVDLRNYESECSCSTDHKCVQQCEVCPRNKCSKLAGHHHSESHLCEFGDHLCKLKCSVPNCKKNCSLKYGHDEATQCNCSQNHRCPEICSLIACNRKCNETLETPHTKHDCGEVCPYRCILDDGNLCSSTDHFHDMTAESVYHDDRLQPLHICNRKHECKSLCERPGFCITGIKDPVQEVYFEGPSKFTYTFYEKTEEKLTCKTLIPEGLLMHDEPHTCNKAFHGCDSKCPCCNVYCSNPHYGHPGLHDNSTHLNQVNSRYVTQSNLVFQVAIEGIKQDFVSGNPCKAETCDAICRRKRGCTRLLTCRGGDECLQVKYPNKAFHNPAIGLPSTLIKDRIRCDQFYDLHQWKSPLETIDKNWFREHIKCNYICTHLSHLGSDSSWCSEPLYHTHSADSLEHRFSCRH
jgi:hypothetical protein